MNCYWSMRPILCGLVICSYLSGCTLSSTPQRDLNFGKSVQQIRQLQTLNPQGADLADQPPGIDAAAALKAQENYLKSFNGPGTSQGGSVLSSVGGK
jgi:hypothetical protein